MKDYSNKGFGTKAIHAGVEPEVQTGAIMTPIFQTSTYARLVLVHTSSQNARSGLRWEFTASKLDRYSQKFNVCLSGVEKIHPTCKRCIKIRKSNDIRKKQDTNKNKYIFQTMFYKVI